MNSLCRYGLNSLERQAETVKINLLMIDPSFLEKNTVFTNIFQNFFNIPDLIAISTRSLKTLKKWGKEINIKYPGRVTLRTYKTLPTMSMVMIDPQSKNTAEILIEFFLYHSGERRPLLKILRNDAIKDGLFKNIKEQYEMLIKDSKKVKL